MVNNKSKAHLLDELRKLSKKNIELEKQLTQHNQVKTKYQENENIYQSIFESLYDVYYRTDKNGQITFISPSIRSQAGYDPQDVIGHPVTDFYHNPHDRKVFIEKLKESGSINDYESQLLAKDGHVIDVSISSRILLGKNGTFHGIEGILRDISARKKTENKLLESEEKFRKAFDYAVIGKAMAEPAGKFIKVNASICRMLGYTEEELLSLAWQDITHPDYMHESYERIDSLFKEKHFNISSEQKLICRDGHHIWVHLTVVLVRDQEGKPLYMIGDIVDISEQKKTEEDQFLISELNNALKEGKSLRDIIQLTSVLTKKMFSGLGAAVYLKDNPNTCLELQNPAITSTFVKKIEKQMGIRIPAIKIPLDSDHKYVDCLKKNEIRHSNTPAMIQQVLDDFISTMEFGGKVLSKITKKMMPQIYKILNLKSIYTVPLFSENEIIGLLDMSSQSHFSDSDLERIKLLAGQLTSIIKRKQTEKALKESEEKIRSISDSAKDAIVMADNHGKITHWNPAAEQLFGYTQDEATRFSLNEIIHSGPRSKNLPKRLQNFGKTGKDPVIGKSIELEVKRKDGRTFPVELSISAIKLKDKWHSVGILRDITERKRAESALQESEVRFRTLSNSAFECIVITDQGRMLDTNEQFLKTFGYKRHELIGQPVMNLVAPESRELVKQNILSGYEKSYEHQALHKNGTIFTVEVTGKSIPYGERQVRVTAIRDITERKKAEEELINSNFWLEESQRVSKIGSYIFNIADNKWAGSKTLDNIFGITDTYEKDVSAWVNIVHPEQKEEMVSYFQKEVLEKHKLFDKEYRIVRINDGEERWVHGHGELSFDKNNNPVKMLGTIQDITERKLAEEEKLLLSTAVEQSTEIIFITGKDSTIQYVNPSFNKITGFCQDEVLGKSAGIFFKNDRRNLTGAIQKVLKKGDSWSGHINCRKKDDSLYEVESTISPIRDQSDEIINHVYVLRDVTHEMTIERQLHQAQKMEAIGTLAGGIAHDSNNMLTVITGYADIMKMALTENENDVNKFKVNLDEILSSARHLEQLNRDLLAFAKQQVIAPKIVDLNYQLKEAKKSFLGNALPETIGIELIFAENLGAVKIDQVQLQQIILNMTANSRDAMPEGGKITLETSSVYLDQEQSRLHGVEAGNYICLTFSDIGAGMDVKTKTRIFEPFFSTKGEGGTGLGLASVYGIMKQNNGYIEVESELGAGTTFRLFFPVAETANETSEKATRSSGIKQGSGLILLVEDEDAVRGLAKRALTKAGYEVIECANPAEVDNWLESYQGPPIDLLLSDVMMPGGTGIEVAEKINAVWPAAHVVYMSGHVEDSIPVKVLENGVNFINKPFSLHNLTDTLRKILGENS